MSYLRGVFSPGGGGKFPRKSKNLPAPGNPKWGPTPRENSPGGGGEFLVFGGDLMGSPYFSSFDYSPPSGGNLVGTWWELGGEHFCLGKSEAKK